MNPWWSVTLDAEGRPTRLFHDASAKRSQDLPKPYYPTGAIWIAKTDALLAARTFYCSDHRFFAMPWQSAVDIDDEEDLAMAEVVFTLQGAQT